MDFLELHTCCYDCSLETGTSIIGWLCLIVEAFNVFLSANDLLNNCRLEDNPAHADTPARQAILANLPALKTQDITLIVLHTVGLCLSIILLMGTYLKKKKLIFYWVCVNLFICIMELAVNLTKMYVLFKAVLLLSILQFFSSLFFILVVYSFNREIHHITSASV